MENFKLGQAVYRPGLRVPEGYAAAVTCRQCSSSIRIEGEIPEEITCRACNQVHHLIFCSECREGAIDGFLITDAELEQLRNNRALPCKYCKTPLAWPSETMVISGTDGSTNDPWSADAREIAYLERVQEKLTKLASRELSYRFRVHHRTTGARVLTALHHLPGIRDMINAQVSFVITPATDEYEVTPTPKHKSNSELPSDLELDMRVFGFINSLRSSLDILAQEIAQFYGSTKDEGKIDFKTLQNQNVVPHEGLRNRAKEFADSDTFIYLNSLRNTSQHRRLATTRAHAVFNTGYLIGPKAVKELWPVSVYVLLPDDPEALPDAAMYNLKKNLVFTFDTFLREVQEFVMQIYDLAR